MKVEEVIEAVKETIKHQELVQKTFGYRKEEDRALTGNKIIIKSLEKQIAKKPLRASEFTNDYVFDAFICLSCEERVFTHYSCCPECGQKIDWSESEC